MLLKLGLQNNIFREKLDKSKFYSKNDFVYRVKISDPASKLKFISLIGSSITEKINKLNKIKTYFAENSNSPLDYLYSPLTNLFMLNDIKPSYLGGNFYRLLKKQIPMTNYIYKKICSLKKIKPNFGDFIIEGIVDVRKVDYDGFVYDITVEKDHNFLIENGIVSSNCDDFGKRLGTGAHMQELIRTKAGPFKVENSFTLHDLKDAFTLYKNEGNEKEIRKLILPVESGVEHLNKIWVFDGAVNNLCHGSDLYSPGVVKLHKNIERGDLVAVMTLKNELVCLGIAESNSDVLLKNGKGLIAKTKKVFMERNTYH